MYAHLTTWKLIEHHPGQIMLIEDFGRRLSEIAAPILAAAGLVPSTSFVYTGGSGDDPDAHYYTVVSLFDQPLEPRTKIDRTTAQEAASAAFMAVRDALTEAVSNEAVMQTVSGGPSFAVFSV